MSVLPLNNTILDCIDVIPVSNDHIQCNGNMNCRLENDQIDWDIEMPNRMTMTMGQDEIGMLLMLNKIFKKYINFVCKNYFVFKILKLKTILYLNLKLF